MAVTIVSEPGLLSFSKNPVEFHLRTDEWVNLQPVAGVYEMQFTTKLTTIGSSLTLSWNGNTVQFFVESTTTPTGYNLPQDITSTTLAQYVEALADTWFDAQYLLQKDFIIEYVATDTIRFTAREAGTELALTYSTTIPSGHAVFSTATTPIALGTLDDYAIIMDVEVEEVYGSGNFTRIGTLHGTPVLYDDSGTLKGDVKFNVAELLDGALQDKEDSPDVASSTAFIADNTNLQWRAIWAQRYTVGSEVVITKRTQSDDKRVLKGGLAYLDVPALPDLETNYFGAASKPLNTWIPSTKEVTAEEKHWLYFLTEYNLTGLEKFRSTFTVYYTDGTTDTAGLDDVTAQNQWETYAYAVGFNQRGLDTLQPSKTAYKYTVQIIVLPSVPHETITQTFWLVDQTQQDKHFLFENSAQGWDNLRTNGACRAITNISKTEAANMVEAGYAATDAVVKQRTESHSDTFEVFTGFKPRAELEHMRDFLRTERCYEVVNGEKIPVVIDGGSFEMERTETGNYAYGLKFRYRHAFVNKGYSNA